MPLYSRHMQCMNMQAIRGEDLKVQIFQHPLYLRASSENDLSSFLQANLLKLSAKPQTEQSVPRKKQDFLHQKTVSKRF